MANVSSGTSAVPILLGVTGTLFVIILLLFLARIRLRLQQQLLGLDDLTIAFAIAIAVVEWSLIVAAAQYGFGRNDTDVIASYQVKARHLIFIAVALWSSGIMFAKSSILITLSRIKRSRPWHIFLWSMVAVQVLSCGVSLVFQMTQCDPKAFIWDPFSHPRAVCVRQNTAQLDMYIHSGIATATDLALAATPLIYLRKSGRLLHENLGLCFLSFLGVFATASSIARTVVTDSPLPTRNKGNLYTSTKPFMWAFLEQQAAIIAVCISALNPLISHILIRFSRRSPNTYPPDQKLRRVLPHSNLHSRSNSNLPLRYAVTPGPVTLNLILPNPSTTTTSSILPRPITSNSTRHTLRPTTPNSVFSPTLPQPTHPNPADSPNFLPIYPFPGTRAPPQTLDSTPNLPAASLHSSETVWPVHCAPTHLHREDIEATYEEMLAEGGILLTTEFHIQSEVGSKDGEEAVERERMRGFEEEWRVVRGERVRGWDGV